jgi:hypothetical protein
VPHYHLTLTIAKEMRIFFDRDRSLLKLLATEAAASVREVIAAIYGDIRVGMVYTIHTFGRDLLFKPHVHLVLTAGGLNKDGHWIDFDGILGSKLVVTWKKRLCDHLSGCHPQNHPIHTVLRRVRASLQSAGASLPPPLLQNGA